MADFIIILILSCIVGGIIFYLYRAKKRGETCIGCPYAKQCGGCGGGGSYRPKKKKPSRVIGQKNNSTCFPAPPESH